MKQQKAFNVLSVDWDFFFPVKYDGFLYDWGYRDSGKFFLEDIWYHRAASFINAGVTLPGTSGEEHGFWNRFLFRPNCTMLVADSHKEIYNPLILAHQNTRVLSYDAHHDAGYRGIDAACLRLSRMREGSRYIKEGRVSCEDWAQAFFLHGAKITVVYPRWKAKALHTEPLPAVPIARRMDDGGSLHKFSIDFVFICRSGGWVPPWVDKNFSAFVKACPAFSRSAITTLQERTWDFAWAEKQAAAQRKVFEELQTLQRKEGAL